MKTEHLWQFLLIIIGALASAYAGYWFGHQPDESFMIEYRKDTNKNLKNRISDANEIEISYEGKPLNELSNVTFVIANTTARNLDKFKLYFEVSDKKNAPIFHNVSPPKAYPKEAITLISRKNGIYIFELEYLNRSESIWEGLSFSFYFSGDEPPIILVKTGTKGIGIREYEYKRLDFVDASMIVLSKLWWLLIIIVPLLYFSRCYDKNYYRLKSKYFDKAVKNTLNEGGEVNDQAEKILDDSRVSPRFLYVVKHMFNVEKA